MKQKGLSLVELMISALISVVIIQGIFELFFSNLVAGKYHESHSLARERAQQAFFLMTQDIREAGSGGDLVGPGSYNVYYNQRFSGATDSNGIRNLTLPACQARCDASGGCVGFSWANVYVVDGLPAGLTTTTGDPCGGGSSGGSGGSGGSGDPVTDALQPLQDIITELVTAKNLFQAGMGTPPTTEEQTKSDQFDSLENELNQQYNQKQTEFNNANTSGTFDQSAATNDIFTYLQGKQTDLTNLGVTVGDSSAPDAGSSVCSSSAGIISATSELGMCYLQTRPGSGNPSRVNKEAWITYQLANNTLFYNGSCGGVTCTSEGSGTSSDSLAIVLSPTSGQDCIGNTVSGNDVVANRYFITTDSESNNALYCQSFNPADGSSRGSRQLMVSGIERLQVLYGYADSGGPFVTSYREASNVTDWMYVRSVHIGVLAGGSNFWGSSAKRDRTYNLMGTGNFTLSDSRKEFFPFTTVQRLYTNRDDTSWRERRVYRSD